MTTSKTMLLAALLLAGCSGSKSDDSGATGTPTGSSLPFCGGDLEGQNLPSALYSVSGTSASDVWTVGTDDGTGPLVLHYDGSAWSRVATGLTGDLLWVWVASADSVWFAGRGGRVVHHVPSTGAFTEHAAARDTDVLWGMWGSSATDVWAVGQGADNLGVIVHYDGAAWSAPTVPTELTDAPIWKLWGTGPSDIVAVGADDLIAHYDGSAWTPIASPITSQTVDFLTVDGCGSDLAAVGGYGNGKVAASIDGGTTWVDQSPEPLAVAPAFIGVHVSCDHGAYAVGGDLAVWERDGAAWVTTCEPSFSGLDFHGTWVDPDGGIWSVGGDLEGGVSGVVDYTGSAPVPDVSL